MKNINEDLIKRSLLYMNYDSKKTLNENISNINLLTEDTTTKAYDLFIVRNSTGFAIQVFNLPNNLNIVSDNKKITIGTGPYKFTYNCGSKYFVYDGTMTGSGGSTYTNKELSDLMESKYCKTTSKTSSFDWMANGNNNYWQVLKTSLEKNDLVPYVKESSSEKNGSFYYWGKFIIWRNLSSNFISHQGPDATAKIDPTNYNGKYAGQQQLSNINLILNGTGEKMSVLDFITKYSSKTKDWKDGGGVQNDPGPKKDYTPGGGGKPKNECKGTYSMGCITPEVGEAQQCLKDDGLYPYRVDNKFGSKTRDAVKAKIGKTYFTDADLQTICKTKKGGGGEDEYDFDKDMGGGSGGQEKEDTTWTGDVY